MYRGVSLWIDAWQCARTYGVQRPGKTSGVYNRSLCRSAPVSSRFPGAGLRAHPDLPPCPGAGPCRSSPRSPAPVTWWRSPAQAAPCLRRQQTAPAAASWASWPAPATSRAVPTARPGRLLWPLLSSPAASRPAATGRDRAVRGVSAGAAAGRGPRRHRRPAPGEIPDRATPWRAPALPGSSTPSTSSSSTPRSTAGSSALSLASSRPQPERGPPGTRIHADLLVLTKPGGH